MSNLIAAHGKRLLQPRTRFAQQLATSRHPLLFHKRFLRTRREVEAKPARACPPAVRLALRPQPPRCRLEGARGLLLVAEVTQAVIAHVWGLSSSAFAWAGDKGGRNAAFFASSNPAILAALARKVRPAAVRLEAAQLRNERLVERAVVVNRGVKPLS